MGEKVRFVRNEKLEAQGKVQRKFREGKVYDLSPRVAQRWIRRGACVRVSDETAKKPEKPMSQPKGADDPKGQGAAGSKSEEPKKDEPKSDPKGGDKK